MSKAPAALGAGDARTWPCGCRAPLGSRGKTGLGFLGQNQNTTTERNAFGPHTRQELAGQKAWGASVCAAPHARRE
jgi:hypothetical protein